jgi:hypothetical protein
LTKLIKKWFIPMDPRSGGGGSISLRGWKSRMQWTSEALGMKVWTDGWLGVRLGQIS